MKTKTPKEMAEALAMDALASLQAALAAESEQRHLVREMRREGHEYSAALDKAERKLADLVKCSDAAFKAWRDASEAVPR